MNRLIAVVAVLALGACSPEAETAEASPTEAPAQAAAAPSQLGGIDLSQPLLAMGSEPFWSVEIVDGVATWKDIGDFSGDVTTPRTGPAIPTAAGDGVAYAITLTDGTLVTLTLTAGPCADLGEQTRALNATLAWGDSTQAGCADALSAYPPATAG
ncbi:hypothetical protein [Brevundimonas aurifodinae]|uniref:Uncharacterized protein n=2 Tax=Brevundimonas TaxID=41275 RepID=A0ABV1NQV3_9CAUL|nr:MAG: hypothetical protein B7Z42_02870 [Brevundimonas sp. 12-68-7]OYX33424.1 MAG: hypothetical protein B7Z01_08815 [Brevundimonas subvibrioides]